MMYNIFIGFTPTSLFVSGTARQGGFISFIICHYCFSYSYCKIYSGAVRLLREYYTTRRSYPIVQHSFYLVLPEYTIPPGSDLKAKGAGHRKSRLGTKRRAFK